MKKRRGFFRRLSSMYAFAGLFVTFISASGCGSNESSFEKLPHSKSQHNSKWGTDTQSQEAADLLFDHLNHAHWAMELLANQPQENAPKLSDCVRFSYRPGQQPFLSAHYDQCSEQIKTNTGVYHLEYSGSEDFFTEFVAGSEQRGYVAKSRNLRVLVVRKVGNSYIKFIYNIDRELDLHYRPFARNQTENLYSFEQVLAFQATSTPTRKEQLGLTTWTSRIHGQVRVKRASGAHDEQLYVSALEPEATFKLLFEIPPKQASGRSPDTYRFLMVATGPVQFAGPCRVPVGTFEWEYGKLGDSDTKKGSFETRPHDEPTIRRECQSEGTDFKLYSKSLFM